MPRAEALGDAARLAATLARSGSKILLRGSQQYFSVKRGCPTPLWLEAWNTDKQVDAPAGCWGCFLELYVDWCSEVEWQSGHITQAHRFPSEQVKLGRVQAVLRWGTTREGWMLLFLFSHPSFLRFCPVSPCYYPLRVPRQAQLSRCTSNPEPVRLAFKPGARSAPATHK